MATGPHGIRRAAVKPDEFALDINENRLQFCKDKLGVHYNINAKDADVLEQIKNITNNEMPTLVIDATGNQKAINNAFQYMAHGARFILIGLQKQEISFSHSKFHKREATLMSSRNATRTDFKWVIKAMKGKQINPTNYITHRI